eukprot:3738377-Amphidinium_carterae.1
MLTKLYKMLWNCSTSYSRNIHEHKNNPQEAKNATIDLWPVNPGLASFVTVSSGRMPIFRNGGRDFKESEMIEQ